MTTTPAAVLVPGLRMPLSVVPATLAFCFLAASQSGFATEAEKLVVTGNNVNVREAPNISANRIAQLSKNHFVRELDRDGEWVRIEIIGSQGATGWIHRNYIDVNAEIGEQIECKAQQTDTRKGNHNEIHWVSEFAHYGGWYCFRRSIEITEEPFKYFIHWPVANIVYADVNEEITIDAAFYRGLDEHHGELEFGYFGRTTPTTVFRGEDEAKVNGYMQPLLVYTQFDPNRNLLRQQGVGPPVDADEKWTRIEGFVNPESGEAVYVSLFVRSGFRDVSEGQGKSYEYFYNVINNGASLVIDWASAYSFFTNQLLKDAGHGYPIDVGAEDFKMNLAGISASPPTLNSDVMTIFTEDETKLMQVMAPAYVPKQE